MVTTTLVFWITTQDHGGDVTMTQFHNSDFSGYCLQLIIKLKCIQEGGWGDIMK